MLTAPGRSCTAVAASRRASDFIDDNDARCTPPGPRPPLPASSLAPLTAPGRSCGAVAGRACTSVFSRIAPDDITRTALNRRSLPKPSLSKSLSSVNGWKRLICAAFARS